MNGALPRLAEAVDLLLCECSFRARDGARGHSHLNAGQAGRMAARVGVGGLLLTHCYPEFNRDAAPAAARGEFGGPVSWARQAEELAV